MTLDRALRRAYLGAAIAWALALPLAAAAAAMPHRPTRDYAFAAVAYAVGRVICHQQAGRSFHLWGAQLPVCARCTGIYLGAAVAGVALAVAALVGGPRRGTAGADTVSPSLDRAVLLAACVPIGLTLVFEWTTGIATSNTVRMISGLPVGAAVTWAIVVRR